MGRFGFREAQGGRGHLHELLGRAAGTPAVGVRVAGGDLLVACLAVALGDVRRDPARGLSSRPSSAPAERPSPGCDRRLWSPCEPWYETGTSGRARPGSVH